MKAPYTSTNRVLVPEGTMLARIIEIVYIGTVKTQWQGQEKEVPKLRLTWELPTEKHVFKEGEAEKPFVISQEYTHSMGKKANLRPLTEAIIGTSLTDDEAFNFDHDNLLGLPCQITVIHEDKETGTYAKVSAVSQLLKGVACPPPINDIKKLSFDKWDEKYFQALPQFIKIKIESSKEYKKMKGMVAEKEIDVDSIPF